MEINFKELTLDMQNEVSKLLLASKKRLCDYTFCNLYCWDKPQGLRVSCDFGTVVAGFPEKRVFYMPAGENAVKALHDIADMYGGFELRALQAEDADTVKSLFPNCDLYEDKPGFDYIYTSESLRTLRGKKLASKRNHINAFISDGEWYSEIMTAENAQAAAAFTDTWCSGMCDNGQCELKSEICSAKTALNNFETLGLSGLLLYKDKKLVAYACGEPESSSVFCVHFEKANADIRGAYQMINREFARTFCADFEYINREDDADDEGLRRAKLSYQPTALGKKYRAVIRKD